MSCCNQSSGEKCCGTPCDYPCDYPCDAPCDGPCGDQDIPCEGDVAGSVSTYYGKTLKSTSDLKTNACTCSEVPPAYIQRAMTNVHPEVLAKYYGCGLVVPECIEGMSILDLGCGAGQDVYILAQLVGPRGRVVGIDMTDEQLDVARTTMDWHTQKFGYASSNVSFIKGDIEKIAALGIPDESFDIIVSNCVINLCENKEAVLSQAFRVLKPGGEIYFSDVYSNVRVPAVLRKDKVLWGECISGALYWNDFLNLSKKCGFTDPRLVKDSRITMKNKEIEALVGHIQFYSATYRLWKIAGLDPDCEDYGQAVVYKGTIADHPHNFALDAHHDMKTGKIFPVCGNTFRMLSQTRLAPHFQFLGNFDKHFGVFENCGKSIPFSSSKLSTEVKGKSCC